VAVVTNAGGLGILCADACESAGLELPSLGEDTRAALAARLPSSPVREGRRRIASFAYPESAAAALGHAAARAEWLRRPAGSVPELDRVDTARARELVAGDDGWLAAPQVRSLLEAYGLPLVAERYVESEEDGLAAVAELGFPVVAKTTVPGVHKSERGGVGLDLRDAGELRQALARVGLPAVIQPMVRGGAELLAGVVQDPVFGPLVAFGPGGVLAEIIGDAQVRIAPLTDADAEELVLGGKAGRLVRGFRTRPHHDALARTLEGVVAKDERPPLGPLGHLEIALVAGWTIVRATLPVGATGVPSV
jgi:acetate---CoA ligase (ADP-forming)